ncbi:MAG: GDP-mannose 4,6-dehydratase [Deltaproteobacteria bacterium]|nr:GDP-mannose 4,6-dehydratase [Deltaproteobacteria bacterium]
MTEFWQDRPVLVTGADGFIGSHLVQRLVVEGARVRAFCFYNSTGSTGWLDGVDWSSQGAPEIRMGDVRDAGLVGEACRGMDVVFHLAALIAIPYSYRAPESFIDTNVKGTLNVLEGVRRWGGRRMVQTSTSEVYGTPAELPIRETHPLQGQSPYSASKIAADKLCEAYHCSFGVPVVTLRPFNTYGPRQSLRAVLPTMLAQLLAGRGTVQLGRLDTRRDLTYVSDTVEGFLRAGEVEGIEGDVFQLGTGNAVSIGELFEAACRVLGVKASVAQDSARLRPDRSEVMVLLSDPAKARRVLGWEPTVGLEEGLKRTAAWLAMQPTPVDPERYHV